MTIPVTIAAIPVILASQSRSRREVLRAAGVLPTIRVSHVDEPQALIVAACEQGVSVDALSVEQRVLALAHAKAQAVYQAYREVARAAQSARGERVIHQPFAAQQQLVQDVQTPLPGQRSFAQSSAGPLIIGCDSLFLFDGEITGKPHTIDVARERLRAMRGKSGELWTGHSVINFATGEEASAASHAIVHFAQFSDEEIERYLATGEPYEVAGTFTLEGYGAAFISGIEGAPSGVQGVSVPLLRDLVKQLGIAWTDLWNIAPERAVKSDPYSTQTPKDNVHQPGDGWVDCACGKRHWGTNGAAGILLARRDATTGEVSEVVLQHRAMWSAEGGTWGVPGGAIADGETPIEGALRESFEEANITPADIEVVGSYREDHGSWSYTTVFAFEKPGHEVKPRANDDESIGVEWIPFEQVPQLKLISSMRHDWPQFSERLQQLAGQYDGR